MREGFLLPGVVLLVLMALFAFVPLPYPASGSVNSTGSLVVHPPAFPYSQATPLSLQWSGGNSTTWVEIIPCAISSCSDVRPSGPTAAKPSTPQHWAGLGFGASGAFTIWVPTNASLLVLTNSSSALSITVTWNEMPEFGFVWTILLLVGVLLTIPGMFLPEKGSPRGHHRRLHYFHWRHHPFALPPHLPVAGLTCPACGLADIPHEDDYCPRCNAQLPRTSSGLPPGPAMAAPSGPAMGLTPVAGPGPGAMPETVAPVPPATAAPEVAATPATEGEAGGAAVAGSTVAAAAAVAPAATEAAPARKRTVVDKSKVAGQSLSVADPDPMRPWRVVRGLGFAPEDVLIFTREDTSVLIDKYHFVPDLTYSLSRNESEHAISPAETDRIADLADQHLRARSGGAVVLTDPNYFVTHVGFEALRRLTHAIQDHARERRGTFILAFNPQVLSGEQRVQLEERMRKVV